MKKFFLIYVCFLLWLSIGAAFAQSHHCDPFTAHCRIQPISLKNYPLESLSLIGTITAQNHSWALIKTPEDTVLLAKLHEHISLQQTEITEITHEHIALKNHEGKIVFLNIQRSLSNDNNPIEQ